MWKLILNFQANFYDKQNIIFPKRGVNKNKKSFGSKKFKFLLKFFLSF